MEITMETLATLVAIVAGLKALEWIFDKIFYTRDKSKQIEANKSEFNDYKIKTDARLDKIEKSVKDGHNFAQESLDELKKEIMATLREQSRAIAQDKADYLEGITEVKASITEMTGLYQQTVAVLECKLDALEKKQDKHNSIIERTYECEKQIGILQKENESIRQSITN